MIILHGLFGMSDNWHNIARKLSETHAVYTLDLRNHGQSPHSDIMNYNVMADDILEFINNEDLDQAIIIGHSMGGKTAMTFANKYPEKIAKLVVVDIAPKAYRPGHQVYFDAMKKINYNATVRKEIEEQLAEKIIDKGELLFLLKNLYHKETGNFGLKINLEAIENNYPEIIGEIRFTKPVNVPTLFIKGEISDYISEKDKEEIKHKFPDVRFAIVPDAGHWVHAENSEGFLKVLKEFISD